MLRNRKTTGHVVAALLLGAWSFLAPPARAGELRLTTSNDLISQDGGDNLYTAALELELDNGYGKILIGERMFTDRERGWRHDETYLELGREVPSRWGWRTQVRAGVLRVGHGLFGESAQNQIHRWVGADRVDLEYVGGTDHFASFGVVSESPLGALGSLDVTGRAEAYTAPGFRSWMRAEVGAAYEFASGLTLLTRLGVRTDDVESFRLAPHVGDSGWSAGVSIAWRRLRLGWNRNDDGTGADHLTLGVRIGPSILDQGPAAR